MYNHPYTTLANSYSRERSSSVCEFFTLYYNKISHKREETLYTPSSTFQPCFVFVLPIGFDSIGRPGRAGTSSPRASPSRTWEGGRSMRRCGSGAGNGLLACIAFDIFG